MKQANKAVRRKKEKWNFKPYLIIAAALLLILGTAAIITHCSAESEREVLKFTYENGQYYDKKNDITYVQAPFYYQSKLMTSSDYTYATSDLFDLYRVGYRDENDQVHLVSGELWLSTAMDVGALLYYNPEKVDLPEPHEFEGDSIYLCEPNGTSLFSTTKIEGNTATKLLGAFFTETDTDCDEYFSACTRIGNLKISSEKYQWIYLNLWLYVDEEGNFYLYEQVTQRFHRTDAEVFAPFYAQLEDESAAS